MIPMQNKKDFMTGQPIATAQQQTEIWANLASLLPLNQVFYDLIAPALDSVNDMIKKIEVIQEYATQNANLMLDPAERAYLQKITEYITQIEGNDTWKTMIIPLDQNPNSKKGVMDFGQMEQTNPMF